MKRETLVRALNDRSGARAAAYGLLECVPSGRDHEHPAGRCTPDPSILPEEASTARQLGRVLREVAAEDRNIRIDVRYAAGTAEQYPALAKELAALQPDVFLSESTPAAAALKQETGTIPIVFVGVSDPVGSGFVTSLARPRGGLTGMMQYESGIWGSGSRCSRRSRRISPASHSSPIQNSKATRIQLPSA